MTATTGGTGSGDPLGAFVLGPRLLVRGAPGGPLAGTRFAVKDLFDVTGTVTGAGNPDRAAGAAPAAAHASAVHALLAAGADLWGKTVTDELAFSLSGTNVHYGTPVNPAAPGRVPGGSSSGSASAVAGRVVDLALGTDTGGSTRVPASYCGILGLRPTHGRIDEHGLLPLAPTFDTVGLLAARGPVLATGWRALAAGAASPQWALGGGTPGASRVVRRLVVATDLFALADAPARDALLAAAGVLGTRLGLPVVEVALGGAGHLDGWRDAFRAIQLVEAWQVDGPWLTTRRPRLGPGIEARFRAAAHADPAEAGRARPVRSEVLAALRAALDDDGLLLQPAASGVAPPPELAPDTKDDLRARTLTLTAPAGMAGAPVVSLPLASVDGLPVGLAVVGLPGDDELLVDLAGRMVP